MRGPLAVATVLALALAAAPARAQGPVNLEDPPCPGFGSAPDLAACGALGIGGANGKLAAILCVVQTINEWQHAQLQCLEEQVQRRASEVMYPVQQVLAQVNMTLRHVNTLRNEVERLACDWRFSPRTRLLEGVYLRRVKFCRPSIEQVLGRSDGYWTWRHHQLGAWTSATTKNLIAERTGLEADLGPESTWLYTAMSVAGTHIEDMASPAQAIRLASTSAADRLRAKNSTLDMQAQRLLVGEQLRAWRARERSNQEAMAWYLNWSVASWRQPCVGEDCGR